MDEYTEELAETICARLAEGESLSSICRDEGMPNRSTVWRWGEQNEGFAARYEKARRFGYLCRADVILDVADDSRNDYIERLNQKTGATELVPDLEHIARARLRVDTYKWVLAKMLPKVYGDSVALKHSDPDGKPLQIGIVSFADVPNPP